jgi:hypothetical protein
MIGLKIIEQGYEAGAQPRGRKCIGYFRQNPGSRDYRPIVVFWLNARRARDIDLF